jgi:toxin secretion/phage lysis holin
MKQGTDTMFTFLTGGAISGFAYLLGGMDKLFIAFVVFMICDYITGMLAAAEEGAVSSKRAFRGLGKKTGMITFVIVAHQLDLITGNTEGFLRNAMLLFLVGSEGISIIENLGRLGLPIPDFITNALERLKGDKELKK